MKKPWIFLLTAGAVLLLTVILVLCAVEKPPAEPAPTDPTECTTQTTEPTQATEASIPPTTAAEPTEPIEPTGIQEDRILERFLPYYQQNQDMVAWICLPGTKIDYPVLQTGVDNMNYYLDKDFDHKPSKAGALYIREFCDVFRPSDNVVIYGHNMKNGSMFGILDYYTNPSYWEKHQTIEFHTLYEEHTYQIFAVFAISADPGNYPYHQFNDAASQEEFDAFIRIVTNAPDADPAITKKIKYYINPGITPQYGDKLITLSTCEYTMGDNGRLVVMAYRIS